LNLGADWGVTDPQTGIFSADTRYNFRTHDGANILLQTSGPAQPEGGLQLRVLFETGDKDYYWLNNVVAVGKLSSVEEKSTRKEGDSFFLRIDVWHVSIPLLFLFGFVLLGWGCWCLLVVARDCGERIVFAD
jgi:hypothetical protein